VIFSGGKAPGSDPEEKSSSLVRIIGLLIEGLALHSVDFDSEQHGAFRLAIREVAKRFERAIYFQDFLALAGEANKMIQSYGESVEKYIRFLTTEKHLAINLLSESLLRVCNSSDKSAEALRHVEKDLKNASQLDDMRLLRAKLAEVVDTVCQEAKRHEQQVKTLLEQVSESGGLALGARDPITGLSTLKRAEARINEVANSGRQGFVLVFFLRNVDVVNRRFGYAAGDAVLQKFTAYLRKKFVGLDQLFRWRGPCFLVVVERTGSLETFRVEAERVGSRGPEQEVEGNGKSMLFRLTAANAVFPIGRAQDNSDLSGKIDRFAAEQFTESSSRSGN
jgi:GGDEF domain-containing protein